jgi:uncharacterized protein YodC (DUF2158 family)
MKKFTTAEIRDLLNQVYREEISFSRMVEMINERVDEKNEPQYKDGDFVVSESGNILIFRKKDKGMIYDHALFNNVTGLSITQLIPSGSPIMRHATEEEKQKMLDALAKEGKRWNEEKKYIEDIPKRKFNVGDRVRIKEGISSKTHNRANPRFAEEMDDFIGKTMTVNRYTDENGYVVCNGSCWCFHEDWLEPYEGLKEGDLAIFWDDDKNAAVIGKYGKFTAGQPFPHSNHREHIWKNAIKFESKEQFEKLIKGEI